MVKILKERQPRFFIAENVKGIMSANKGKAFPMIIKEFTDAGYKVTYKLLNASEYGVPQSVSVSLLSVSRTRMII